MSKTKTVMEQRPNYFRTQLLLENDFLAEQNYHINARRRHSANLHGWGVVNGLTISRESAQSIAVQPGFAVDKLGNEIFLKNLQPLNLAEFRPNERLKISLGYEDEEDTGSEGNVETPQSRRNCYAVVTVSEILDQTAGVTLATVQLDGQGRLGETAIDYSETRYAKIVAPGSITSIELHDSLKKGWLRLPFRPAPMIDGPGKGDEGEIPVFRVGATETLSPGHTEEGERDKGAGGTMAIPIPPSVKHVTGLRIAGSENKGGIHLRLLVGGWDRKKREHFGKTILDETIPAEQNYLKEYTITDTFLDPEYHTLSLWLRGIRRTAISLVAVEFAY